MVLASGKGRTKGKLAAVIPCAGWLVAGCLGLLMAPGAGAAPVLFTTELSGPNEEPPNTSPGTGSSLVTFDLQTHTLRVEATFEGLLGETTVAHIHSPTALPRSGTAGVATEVPTFSGFPVGVTEGAFDQQFNTTELSTYNPTFVSANGGTAAGAEAALFAGLLEGKAYLNIHTDQFPAGEIRGFYQLVPLPGAIGLLAPGLGGLALLASKRRRLRAAEA